MCILYTNIKTVLLKYQTMFFTFRLQPFHFALTCYRREANYQWSVKISHLWYLWAWWHESAFRNKSCSSSSLPDWIIATTWFADGQLSVLFVLQTAQTLHWLLWVPVVPHGKFKTLLLTYKAKHLPPDYEIPNKTKHRFDARDIQFHTYQYWPRTGVKKEKSKEEEHFKNILNYN